MGLFTALRSMLKNDPVVPKSIAQTSDCTVQEVVPTISSNLRTQGSLPPIVLFRHTFPAIGMVDPICPNCLTVLDKFPGRKKKCPVCSEFIFVRTRPADRRKVLVTEEQAGAIEMQYDEISGIDTRGIEERFTNEDAAVFHKRKIEMTKTSNQEPQNWQVCVSILEGDSITHKNNNDWGLFRNARLDIATLYQKAGFSKESLPYYCEVCYVDMNGGRNCGGSLSSSSPFDPFLFPPATGVYELILRALRHANQTDTNLKEIFVKASERLRLAHSMPVQPEQAFSKFLKQLEKQEST